MARSVAFNQPETLRRLSLGSALLAFLVTVTLYLATMSRTTGFIDSGELAAVATTLGIAHPTGYPTLTLLGHVAVRLVPWARPVLVLNALSALWSATGVALATLVLYTVLRSVFLPTSDTVPATTSSRKAMGRRGDKTESTKWQPSEFELAAFSFLGATFVGLSTTWWSQATGFEVYSLHAVLLGLVTLTFFRYLEELGSRPGQARLSRWGFVFPVCVGLSFTNHLSTGMLAPALLYLFFRTTKLTLAAFQELACLIPGALVGLLPYAYLPLRASTHPGLNWGDPDSVSRFIEHISGAQFHFAVAFEPRVFGQQTAYLVNSLVNDTSVVGLAVATLGMVLLVRRARVHALWTGILFLSCAVVSGLYDINDIGNYYLPAFLALGVWVAAGLASLAERFKGSTAMAMGVLLVGLNAGRHYQSMNERDNTLAEDLTWNVLRNLPPNSVVISNHWDYWVSASFYAQEVEGLRRDVVVLDPEGLRSETYLEQLQRNHPTLMAPIQNVVGEFGEWSRKLRKHPTMTPAQAEAYYSAYYGMVSTLIERNSDRSFFVTEWTDPRIGRGYFRVPTELAYLLTKDSSYVAQDFPEYRFRPWRNRMDPYVVKISEIYTTSLLSRARYEEEHGRTEQGRRYGLYAMSFDPEFAESEVPDFPLHIEDQIVEILRNYSDLRQRVRGVSRQ